MFKFFKFKFKFWHSYWLKHKLRLVAKLGRNCHLCRKSTASTCFHSENFFIFLFAFKHAMRLNVFIYLFYPAFCAWVFTTRANPNIRGVVCCHTSWLYVQSIEDILQFANEKLFSSNFGQKQNPKFVNTNLFKISDLF